MTTGPLNVFLARNMLVDSVLVLLFWISGNALFYMRAIVHPQFTNQEEKTHRVVEDRLRQRCRLWFASWERLVAETIVPKPRAGTIPGAGLNQTHDA